MANWYDDPNALPLESEATPSATVKPNPLMAAYQRGLAGLNPDGTPMATSPALPSAVPEYPGTPGVLQGLNQYLSQKPKTLSPEAQANYDQWYQSQAAQAPEKESEAPLIWGTDTLAAMKDYAQGLTTTVPAALYRLSEDNTRPDLYSPEAKAAFAAEEQLQKQSEAERVRREKAGESTQLGSAIREAIPSSGFTVGSAVPALTAGLATGAATQAALPVVPGAGIVGGIVGSFAGSGTAAFRMARSMAIDEWFKQAEAGSLAKNKRPLTEAEKQQLYKELQPLATDSGLWEAGPEALGNAFVLVGGGLATGLIGKTAFRKATMGAMKKAGIRAGAAAVGTGMEFGTETATELGQAQADARAEVIKKAIIEGRPIDPNEVDAAVSRYNQPGGGGTVQAFKDIAAPTLGTLVMFGLAGGAVRGGQKAYDRLVTNPKEAQAILDMANSPEVLSAMPESSLRNLEAMTGHLQKKWFQGDESRAALEEVKGKLNAELSSRSGESADLKIVRQQTLRELWEKMAPPQQKGILAFLGNEGPGLTGYLETPTDVNAPLMDKEGNALGEIDARGLRKLAPLLGLKGAELKAAQQRMLKQREWYSDNAPVSPTSDGVVDDYGVPLKYDHATKQWAPEKTTAAPSTGLGGIPPTPPAAPVDDLEELGFGPSTPLGTPPALSAPPVAADPLQILGMKNSDFAQQYGRMTPAELAAQPEEMQTALTARFKNLPNLATANPDMAGLLAAAPALPIPTPPVVEPPTSTAGQIQSAFDALASGANEGARRKVRDDLQSGNPPIYRNPSAIAAAKANPNYRVEDLPDGTVRVTGVLDPDTQQWVGTPQVSTAPSAPATPTPGETVQLQRGQSIELTPPKPGEPVTRTTVTPEEQAGLQRLMGDRPVRTPPTGPTPLSDVSQPNPTVVPIVNPITGEKSETPAVNDGFRSTLNQLYQLSGLGSTTPTLPQQPTDLSAQDLTVPGMPPSTPALSPTVSDAPNAQEVQAQTEAALNPPTPAAEVAGEVVPTAQPESAELPLNTERAFRKRKGFARRSDYRVVQTIEAFSPTTGETQRYDIVELRNDSNGRLKTSYQLMSHGSDRADLVDATTREQVLAHLPKMGLTLTRQSASLEPVQSPEATNAPAVPIREAAVPETGIAREGSSQPVGGNLRQPGQDQEGPQPAGEVAPEGIAPPVKEKPFPGFPKTKGEASDLVQRLSQSIAEGEMRVRRGKNSLGEKLSDKDIDETRRSVENTQEKLRQVLSEYPDLVPAIAKTPETPSTQDELAIIPPEKAKTRESAASYLNGAWKVSRPTKKWHDQYDLEKDPATQLWVAVPKGQAPKVESKSAATEKKQKPKEPEKASVVESAVPAQPEPIPLELLQEIYRTLTEGGNILQSKGVNRLSGKDQATNRVALLKKLQPYLKDHTELGAIKSFTQSNSGLGNVGKALMHIAGLQGDYVYKNDELLAWFEKQASPKAEAEAPVAESTAKEPAPSVEKPTPDEENKAAFDVYEKELSDLRKSLQDAGVSQDEIAKVMEGAINRDKPKVGNKRISPTLIQDMLKVSLQKIRVQAENVLDAKKREPIKTLFDVVEPTEKPFGELSSKEQEQSLFGTWIRYISVPATRKDPAEIVTTQILQSKNNGALFETGTVTDKGVEFAFRIRGDQIIEIEQGRKEKVSAPSMEQPSTPIAQGTQQKPDTGRFVPNSKVFNATEQGQKAMAQRGSFIATLKLLNNQVRATNPAAAYTDEQIENIADDKIDTVRDWLIQQQKSEPKPPVEPAPLEIESKVTPTELNEEAVRTVALRFGLTEKEVQDALSTPADELAARDELVPSNVVDAPPQFKKYPIGSAQIDGAGGNFENRYVNFLREFNPNDLKLAESEEGIKKHHTYSKYVEWSKEGIDPPYIFVAQLDNGKLQTSNRRRTLAAQESGAQLKGWFGPHNAETNNPLKLGDLQKAYEQIISPATPEHVDTQGDVEPVTSEVIIEAFEESVKFKNGKEKQKYIADHIADVIQQIDQAIAEAPAETLVGGRKPSYVSDTPPDGKEFITIKVPGDGTFRIPNQKRLLEKFKTNITKSPIYSSAFTKPQGLREGAVSSTAPSKMSERTPKPSFPETALADFEDNDASQLENLANVWELLKVSNISYVLGYTDKRPSTPILMTHIEEVANGLVSARIFGDNINNRWVVVNPQSGYVVLEGKSRKAVVEKVKENIKTVGSEKIKSYLEKGLAESAKQLGVEPTGTAVQAALVERMDQIAEDVANRPPQELVSGDAARPAADAFGMKPRDNFAGGYLGHPQEGWQTQITWNPVAKEWTVFISEKVYDRYSGKSNLTTRGSQTVNDPQQIVNALTDLYEEHNLPLPEGIASRADPRKDQLRKAIDEIVVVASNSRQLPSTKDFKKANEKIVATIVDVMGVSQATAEAYFEGARERYVRQAGIKPSQKAYKVPSRYVIDYMMGVKAFLSPEDAKKAREAQSSRTPLSAPGLSQSSLIATLRRRFPHLSEALDTMLARGEQNQKGGLVLVDSNDLDAIAQVFAEKTGRTQDDAVQELRGDGRLNGLYDPRSGLTFVILPNLSEASAPGVFLHENVHAQQRADIDARAQELVNSRSTIKQPELRAFLNRVQSRLEASDAANNPKEVSAYLIEELTATARLNGMSAADGKFLDWVDRTFGQPVGSWIRDVVKALRGWAFRHGLLLKASSLSLDDLMAWAEAGVERTAAGQVEFSTTGAMVASVMKGQPLFSRTLTADELLAQVQSGQVDTLTPDQWAQVQRAFLQQSTDAIAPTGTQAPSFQNWFGASRIKNKAGQPLPMYHATDADFTVFDATKSGQSTTHPTAALGFFFTNDRGHAAAKYGSNVLEVYLAIEKPYAMTDADLRKIETVEDSQAFRQKLEAQGYDGIVMPAETRTRYVAAFRSDQIKRTDNQTYTKGEKDIRFSKGQASTLTNEQKTAWATEALKVLVANPDVFQYPKSDKKEMADIAADLTSKIKVSAPDASKQNPLRANREFGQSWKITMPDGKTADVLTSKSGREVYIDASGLQEGKSFGSLLYQLVGQWAHNNGKVFVGDPLGISPAGKARRLENMISLALKFGTTDFFMPHSEQNIPWKVGEHDYNVTQMLIASSQAIYQAVPALKGVRYDFEKRKFRDILGQRISQDMFGEFAKSPGAREARAGRTTLKRSILIDSLVQSAGREGWRSVLEELARQGRAVRLTPALKRIFYSKSSQTPVKVGVSASRITEALIQPQLAAWNEAGLSVEVVQSVADLPADLQARLPDDSVEGFYETQTGKVYLIADRLSSMERAKEVLRHEAVGHWASHHLRAAPEFVQILKALVRLEAVGNQDTVAIAKQVDATQPGLDRFDRAEEIYSVAVERGLHEKIGLLRTWSTKLLQQVKAWLRKLGFDNRFVNTMTLNDVMLWAKESQQRLNHGGKGTYGKWALAGSRGVNPSFAGQTARTADLSLLPQAQLRVEKGEDAETVRKDTGWHQGADTKWRFEIDDSQADWKIPFDSIKESALFGSEYSYGLKDVLNHPGLFAAYPQLEKIKVIKRPGLFDFNRLQGSFNNETMQLVLTPYAKDPLSTLLHEIQHVIQMYEGFAKGGNENSVWESLPRETKETLAKGALEKLSEKAEQAQQQRRVVKLLDKRPDLVIALVEAEKRSKSGFEAYQSAKDSSPDHRRELFKLWNSEIKAVEEAEQAIVRFMGFETKNRLFELPPEIYGAVSEISRIYKGENTKEEMKGYENRLNTEITQIIEKIAKIKSGDEAALRKEANLFEFYKKLAGETEARLTQARQRMTAQERRATSPQSMQEYPNEEQIIVEQDSGTASDIRFSRALPPNQYEDAQGNIQDSTAFNPINGREELKEQRAILQRLKEDGFWKTSKAMVKEARPAWLKLLTLQQKVEMLQDIELLKDLANAFENTALAMDADKSNLKQEAFALAEEMRSEIIKARDKGYLLGRILQWSTLKNVVPYKVPERKFYGTTAEFITATEDYQRLMGMVSQLENEHPKLLALYDKIMGKGTVDANGQPIPNMIERMDELYRTALQERLGRQALTFLKKTLESAQDTRQQTLWQHLHTLSQTDPAGYAQLQQTYQAYLGVVDPSPAQRADWRSSLPPAQAVLWDDLLIREGRMRNRQSYRQIQTMVDHAIDRTKTLRAGTLTAALRDLHTQDNPAFTELRDALKLRLERYEPTSSQHDAIKNRLPPATQALFEKIVTANNAAIARFSFKKKLETLEATAPAPETSLTGRLHTLFLQSADRFNALSKAVTARLETLDMDSAKADALRAELSNPADRVLFDELVADAQEKVKPGLTALQELYERRRMAGPYFPLDRFGPYQVYAEREGHGKDGIGLPAFSTFETEAEQQRYVQRMQQEGWTVRTNYQIREALETQAPPNSFIKKVFKQIDDTNAPEAERQALKNDIYQMYLQSLPELSARKHFLHRKGIPGFSGDVLRSFAQLMNSKANAIARLRYSDRLTDALESMERASKAMGQDPTQLADQNRARMIIGELKDSYSWMMNPSNATLANRLTSLGFFWYLTNISTALVNLTQVPIWTFPELGSKFGTGRSLKVLNKTIADYGVWKLRRGEPGRKLYEEMRGEFNGELGLDLDRIERDGIVSRTQAVTLAGMGEDAPEFRGGATGTAAAAWEKTFKVVSWPFHKTEVANREISFIAAYRLARTSEQAQAIVDKMTEAHAAPDAINDAVRNYAYETARNVVLKTQGNYANYNRAPFMRNNTMRVITLFRSYAQMMTWRMLRDTYQVFKSADPQEKQEIKKRLGLMLASSFLWGGAMGLPIYTIAMSLAGLLFGNDPDDPYEPEEAVKQTLRGLLGETGQQILMGGPVGQLPKMANLIPGIDGVTGVDLSPRVSADLVRLWMRRMPGDLEGESAWDWYVTQALGPIAGMFRNAFRAYGDLVSSAQGGGSLFRSLEGTMPAPIRNALKAARFEEEGVTTRRGDLLVPDMNWAMVVQQAVGFTPDTIAAQYAQNTARYEFKDALEKRRKGLTDRYIYAAHEKDSELTQETLEFVKKFNRLNPETPITAQTLKTAYQNWLRARALSEGGVYEPSKGMRARLRREFAQEEEE